MGIDNALATTESWNLSGPGTSYTFTVNAMEVQEVDIAFSYRVGDVDFWIKVVGED
jgi:hypothetical protein